MKRTNEQAVIMLASLLETSGQTRARISKSEVAALFGVRIRAVTVNNLIQIAPEYGITLVELDTGGFGLLANRTLDGAKTLTFRKHFTKAEFETPNYDALVSSLNLPEIKIEE